MRICIDMGHTPTSPGASGYIDELKEDRALGARLIAELERRGHAVTDTTAPDWMAYPDEVDHRVGKANATDAELFVSIHFNAGGGSGTEVLYFAGDDAGRSYASRISSKLASALGLPDRGPKANDWVGVVCDTNMTAVLVEVCFVDSRSDAAAYDACPWDDLVGAIADAITGETEEGEEMTPQEFWEWSYPDQPTPFYQLYYNTVPYIKQLLAEVAALTAAVEALAGASGADPDAIAKAVADAVERKLESLKITVDGE